MEMMMIYYYCYHRYRYYYYYYYYYYCYHRYYYVFKASQQTGQPLLHTAEGIITIPFTLEEPGSYTIRVPVMGINFIPMATEFADFSVKVE
jgi:hypothetical protein